MTDAPASPTSGGPKQRDRAVQFQELWELFDNERFHSAVMYDITAADPDPKAAAIAEHHRRRMVCFEVAMVLIARVSCDDEIKGRLREIAADEYREAALINPDDDEE